MVLSTYQQKPRTVLATGLLLVGLNSLAFFELGRELGQVQTEDAILHRRHLRAGRDDRRLVDGCQPKKLYGHVHMAKTGGTSVNGILANRYERVCGNKAYSYDAFNDNRKAGGREKRGVEIHPEGRSSNRAPEMNSIGYEDCDYVSREANLAEHYWVTHFGDHRFHNIDMELHVPCRDPIDHLMSQCNFPHHGEKLHLNCDAETDEEYFASVEACYVLLERYQHTLKDHFSVKCYDFKQQFTAYIDYMGTLLEEKRLVPDHYVKRETNDPRDKDSECIWKRPDLIEKTRKYLVETVPYYSFCEECLGSEDDLTRGDPERKIAHPVRVASFGTHLNLFAFLRLRSAVV